MGPESPPIRNPVSAATTTRELHGRTRDVAIGAEHAAVAVLRAEQGVAPIALMEEHARVGRHRELLGIPALGAGERRAQPDGRRGHRALIHSGTTVAVYLSVAIAAIICATVTFAGSNVTTACFFS